jgi:hypothetical protein
MASVFAGVAGKIAEIDSKYGNVYTDILQLTLSEAGLEVGDLVELKFDSKVMVVPFVRNYGDVDRGSVLIRLSGGRVSLAINYGNFAKTYDIIVGKDVELSLVEKGAYLNELEIRGLVRTDARSDYESDAVFSNFRVVALGHIKPGVLFRCSHPSINDPRAPFANELVKQAGIRTVINLADTDEELLSFYQYSDFYRSLGEAGHIINLGMGVDMLSDDFSQKMKEGLLFLIENEPPYLVHCVEGKDRAGIVSALLEALMGATAEEVFHDYVISYENYYHVKPGTPAYDAVKKIIVDIFKSMNDGNPVDDSNIRFVALKFLRTKVGLSLEEIEGLKAALQ